ncbi:hypothetical protein [Nocardia rosealba]|uniref:hypothetical protein n=1 Tax=Nocardia rosealba TaxID=2878563 RepID=UPI001CD95F65|nr:hypothetical protein [Nocardia rosealba]MCA2206606.1 hypothetical protein [Nocardia rosealba]
MQTLRLLVAEGGSATSAHIEELTGAKSLSGAKSAQRHAFRSMPLRLRQPECLIEKKHLDNRQEATIERYFIRVNLLPSVREVLDQIDREHR